MFLFPQAILRVYTVDERVISGLQHFSFLTESRWWLRGHFVGAGILMPLSLRVFSDTGCWACLLAPGSVFGAAMAWQACGWASVWGLPWLPHCYSTAGFATLVRLWQRRRRNYVNFYWSTRASN
jgi:hypothetical protein